ncbi:MAG: hypothetical protein HFH68_12165 [Lachnospiraceae bacterium]|nr:hypothetical protein [Lachnospiraceae bacterium]
MLTPIDIQNHTLKTSMSGYNKKDTEEFLASILDSYETLFRENRTLKEKITSLSEGIQYYKQMENTLQKALILAEKTSTETQEAAKEQADTIIKDAQAKADLIIKDIKAEADEMKEKKEAAIREAEEKAGQLAREAEIKAETLERETETKVKTVIREAEEKAALIISDAKKQSSDIKLQAQDELDGIRINAIRLVQDYEHYCHQVKKLAKAQLDLLESDEYKLHVTELDIDNNVNDNIEKDSITENNTDNIDNTNDTDNTGNTDGIEQTGTEPPVLEEISQDNKEKFSWNSDGSEYSAAKEPEAPTPFTFIDTE